MDSNEYEKSYNEGKHSYPRNCNPENHSKLSGNHQQDHPQIVYPQNYYYGASPEDKNWVNQSQPTNNEDIHDAQDSQNYPENNHNYELHNSYRQGYPLDNPEQENGVQRPYGFTVNFDNNLSQASAPEETVYINEGFAPDKSNEFRNSKKEELELKQSETQQTGSAQDANGESKEASEATHNVAGVGNGRGGRMLERIHQKTDAGLKTDFGYRYGTNNISYILKRVSGNSPEAFVENGSEEIFGFTDRSIRRGFIRKVYLILICQLLVTLGLVAFAVLHDATLDFIIHYNYSLMIAVAILCATAIAIVFCTKLRRRVPYNYIFLIVFTIAESFVLGIIACLFAPNEVMLAIAITTAVCLGLTLFAVQTKWDFTLLGGFLVSGSVIFIFFGITATLFRSSGNDILTTVYASAGALLFSLFLVYDTQLIIGGKHKHQISPEEYIFAALTLYADVINIFLFILILISKAKN